MRIGGWKGAAVQLKQGWGGMCTHTLSRSSPKNKMEGDKEWERGEENEEGRKGGQRKTEDVTREVK